MVSDPNISDFYSRIHRIQKARAKGQGFEAPGTLGRSFYHRPARRRYGIVLPMIVLLMSVFGLKAALLHNVGSELYAQRVHRLQTGTGVEPLAAWIMQADPVSLTIEGWISRAADWLK